MTQHHPPSGTHTSSARHASDPRTACPHDRSQKEAVAGMRCCGSVLKRKSRKRLKDHSAEATTTERRNTRPSPKLHTMHDPRGLCPDSVTTRCTNSKAHKSQAHNLRPPNRLPARPLQERSGRWHAVLRRCAEAGHATCTAHSSVTGAPRALFPDNLLYISMRAKSSSPSRTARHTSQAKYLRSKASRLEGATHQQEPSSKSTDA